MTPAPVSNSEENPFSGGWGRKIQGVGKFCDFRLNRRLSRKRYEIGPWLLLLRDIASFNVAFITFYAICHSWTWVWCIQAGSSQVTFRQCCAGPDRTNCLVNGQMTLHRVLIPYKLIHCFSKTIPDTVFNVRWVFNAVVVIGS